MNAKQLNKLFNPAAIAVIGASEAPNSVGYALFRNLTKGGYQGAVYPVSKRWKKVQGVHAYPNLAALPEGVDLALIVTPADTIPSILQECVEEQILSVVVISAGFSEAGEVGLSLTQQIRDLAQTNGMALLGPNCLGFIRPGINLNASFARKMPPQGEIAFISQSGALCTAVLDWSVKQNVGFSNFVSIGEMADIAFHDLIDFFGNDPATKSILIYMETLTQARSFMSAARSFARTKPIIVLKVGKSKEGARAALSHTGSITGTDQVFEAAFKRAGILRVKTIAELFDCAKTLAMQRLPSGNRLAIVTNAGGPGVIATDCLIEQGGILAELSETTIYNLDKALPEFWSRSNPVDLLGDATPERYSHTVKICLKDPQVDGVLTVLTPQAMTDAQSVAKEVVESVRTTYKTVLAAFMGEDDVSRARTILGKGKIPAYEQPEDAVRSFINMYEYQRNLRILSETPATIPDAFSPKTTETRQFIEKLIAQKRTILTLPETNKILSNYGIPIPPGEFAAQAAEINTLAAKIGFPLVMRVVSPDIVYEAEIEGLVSNIKTGKEAVSAYDHILDRVYKNLPWARVFGVYLQPQIEKHLELLIGAKKDPIFGPAIIFGMGGVALDVFKDTNIGLPPLNMALAQQLIEGTKIAALLKGHRGVPAVDVAAIQLLLYKFAYLIIDFPEIQEIDINPLLVDEHGSVVQDARIVLDEKSHQQSFKPYSHLVISPYPAEYERRVQLKSGRTALLRPIRPEDEPIEAEMLASLSEEAKRFRFFGPIKDVSHEMLICYTQIDYDREIAIIAELTEDGQRKMVGVVRLIADAYRETAEYAIVVADPYAGQGLGTIMTSYILEIAKARGIRTVTAYALEDNLVILHLLKKFGFTRRRKDGMYYLELSL